MVGGVEAPHRSEVLCVSQAAAKRGKLFDAPAWRFEPPLLNASMNLQRTKSYHPETWRCSLWQVQSGTGKHLQGTSRTGAAMLRVTRMSSA